MLGVKVFMQRSERFSSKGEVRLDLGYFFKDPFGDGLEFGYVLG